jgi:hypothetical protein
MVLRSKYFLPDWETTSGEIGTEKLKALLVEGIPFPNRGFFMWVPGAVVCSHQ